ncbi:uncharacterized protein RSE6_02948 [Rhynchosporium secalis]|uniref:Uncharacterized protein n=1 Tax=Rhynchosporium secalis TaxID=38038 RepID=A0A1E1M1I6_RHYSE|nr:uncharacterized protein RSE6_02948 [Rhynchosporium secalis]
MKRAEGTRSEKTKTQQEKPSPNPIHKAPSSLGLSTKCLAPHPSLPVPRRYTKSYCSSVRRCRVPMYLYRTYLHISHTIYHLRAEWSNGASAVRPSVRPSIPGPTSDIPTSDIRQAGRQAVSFSVCVRTSVKSQSNFGESLIFWRRIPIKLSDVYLSACTAPPEVCA